MASLTKAQRDAIHARVEKFGLKVCCLICGFRGRHFTAKQGRLRNRQCPSCGWKSLRTISWIGRYPQKAHKLTAELRQQARHVEDVVGGAWR